VPAREAKKISAFNQQSPDECATRLKLFAFVQHSQGDSFEMGSPLGPDISCGDIARSVTLENTMIALYSYPELSASPTAMA